MHIFSNTLCPPRRLRSWKYKKIGTSWREDSCHYIRTRSVPTDTWFFAVAFNVLINDIQQPLFGYWGGKKKHKFSHTIVFVSIQFASNFGRVFIIIEPSVRGTRMTRQELALGAPHNNMITLCVVSGYKTQ